MMYESHSNTLSIFALHNVNGTKSISKGYKIIPDIILLKHSFFSDSPGCCITRLVDLCNWCAIFCETCVTGLPGLVQSI